MAWVGIAVMMASAVMQARNTAAAGRAEKVAAEARAAGLENQAQQAEQIAGQKRAQGQRVAADYQRQESLLSSRALALAAASGGAADPSVQTRLGEIGAEGEFRALTALYNGEEEAANFEYSAESKRYQARMEISGGSFAKDIAQAQANQQVVAGAGKAFSSAYGYK